MQSKKRRKKKKNNTFAGALLIVTLVVACAFAAYAFFDPKTTEAISDMMPQPAGGNVKNVNFVIFGIDKEGTHTDTIVAGCFDVNTKQISLLSVPRDTRVYMPEDRQKTLRDAELFVPKSGYMKINQVYHYAGEKYGVDFAKKQVGELLGVRFDYYMKVDTDGFRALIDKIGGVTFDVPQRMIYDDPEQGLHINLYPGVQKLNGANAEGLLRYRHGNFKTANETKAYPMADLDRVKVQQAFIKEMMKQILNNKISSLPAVASVLFEYTETDFSPLDTPKYLKYIKEIKPENIKSYNLPCETKVIDGSDYVIIDETLLKPIVDAVFRGIPLPAEEDAPEISQSELEITVLNGTFIDGYASKNAAILTEQGYNVVEVGDYKGVLQPYTRILVKDDTVPTDDLAKIFENSKIEIDNTAKDIYNVTIILGSK
ncbi:transcriptional regulator [Clostridia bacterium]|nr:transcriptional regulator [Clostridia bacterium]